jgi:integral membrane sensor domain MASE1
MQTAEMAGAIGQIGCVTSLVALIIIAIAFGAGWFIDDLLNNERKIVTVILLLGSFPVTLYAMVYISLHMMARLQKQTEDSEKQEN